MELKQIETFIQVAEQNSFTKAAKKLGYTQSAVSLQIKQLEDTLGVVLFERVNHKINLTPKGKEVLDLAHRMIALSDEMIKVSHDSERLSGKIRIAMADSLCNWLFWDNYKNFHTRYPYISLKIISSSTEDMFRLAKHNEVDLIFTLDKHIYDSNYIIAKEYPVGAHFVASAKNRLSSEKAVNIEELLSESLILTEKGMSYRKVLEEYLSSKYIELNPFLEIGNTDLICHLVGQDMGISFLPDFVTQKYVETGKIKRLCVSDFSACIWIQMLYRRDKWITPEMKCVVDYLYDFQSALPDCTKKQNKSGQ